MLLKTWKGFVGHLESYTNTYVVYDETTKDGILIDIANNVDKIYHFIEETQIKLRYIVLTHCHGDHITGLKELKNHYPKAKVTIHEKEAENLTNDAVNLCSSMGVEPNFIEADIVVKEGDVLEFGNTKATIMHTPGHTKGSICILIEDALFSGDTLFKGTIGRVDLPTGSRWEMKDSIDKLLQLPDHTIVYPGHGLSTMICDEK